MCSYLHVQTLSHQHRYARASYLQRQHYTLIYFIRFGLFFGMAHCVHKKESFNYNKTSLIRTPLIRKPRLPDIISQERNFQTLIYPVTCMILVYEISLIRTQTLSLMTKVSGLTKLQCISILHLVYLTIRSPGLQTSCRWSFLFDDLCFRLLAN